MRQKFRRTVKIFMFYIGLIGLVGCHNEKSTKLSNTEILIVKANIIAIQDLIAKEIITPEQGQKAITHLLNPTGQSFEQVLSTQGILSVES